MQLRYRHSVIISVIISVVAIVGGAACGSTTATTTATVPLTQDQFIQQADAICKADTATIAAAAVALGDSPTVQQQQQWITGTVVPLYSHTAAAVGALTPPKEIASKVTAWLTQFKQAITEAKSNPEAMLSGAGAMPTVYHRAIELGLQDCGQAPKK